MSTLPAPAPAKSSRPWLRWVPALLAGAFLLLLLPKIGGGTLWHHDELLTANRSREMIVRGDPFAVTINFEPSVKKPPLQYWACAALLRLLPGHLELALRLPTLLAGAGCLLAAAWLAQVYLPDGSVSLAAWSAAALAGCGFLVHFSRVALLDTGAALFLTLALVGCRLARRDVRWWWFVAAACVLGAWQKAPYGLAAWGIVLAVRFFSKERVEDRPAVPRWRGHLLAALAVAVLGSLGWWFLQWLHTDHAILLRASREQIGGFLRAHDPSDQGFRPWLYWWWMVRDWTLVGAIAPVAVLAACWPNRHKAADESRGELGWVCLVFGAGIACLPYRAERYLVVFTPVLAVLAGDFLRRVSGHCSARVRGWVLPLALAATLPVAAFHYTKRPPSMPDLLAVAQELGRSVRPGEKIFVCTDANDGFDEAGFLLFYANLRQPVEATTSQALWQLPTGTVNRRGICSRRQWQEPSRQKPDSRLVAQHGEWVLWAENGRHD